MAKKESTEIHSGWEPVPTRKPLTDAQVRELLRDLHQRTCKLEKRMKKVRKVVKHGGR
jgi:hypothetical protein